MEANETPVADPDVTVQPLPEGEYAIVEMMGHRTMVGRITEVERFGTKMLMIEPLFRDTLLAGVLTTGASVYQLTPCSREVAQARQPKSEYQLPPRSRSAAPIGAVCTSKPIAGRGSRRCFRGWGGISAKGAGGRRAREVLMSERIRLSRARGWRLPDGAVNVARPSRWGNPFIVGIDGDRRECVHLFALLMGGYLCVSRKADLQTQSLVLRNAREHIDDLRGKDLACWCRFDEKPCHADVLLALANDGGPGCLNEFIMPERGQ
jgi:hypothetical protein